MAGGGRGPAGAARRRAPLGGHGRALRARPAAAPVSGGRAAGLRAAAGGRGAGGCAGRCWGLCGESRAWLRERAEMPSEGREPRPTSLRPSPRSAAMRSAARAWDAPPGPARPRQRREERAPEEAPRCSVRDRGLPTVGLLCAGCRLLGGFLLRGNAKKGAGGDCCGFRVSPSAVRGGERRAFSRVPLCHRGLCRARGCCVCGRLPSFPPRGFRRAPIFLLSSLLFCRSARCHSSYLAPKLLLNLWVLCESFQIGLPERLLGFSKRDADAISPYDEEEIVFLFLVFFFLCFKTGLGVFSSCAWDCWGLESKLATCFLFPTAQ